MSPGVDSNDLSLLTARWFSQVFCSNCCGRLVFQFFVTSVLGEQRWHGIWNISWSPINYWIILRLGCCVLWRFGWLLTNRGKLGWINDWTIRWRRHRYHRWWQLIALWVNCLTIKAPVINRSVLWRSRWLLTKRGQLRWIDDWIIQWRKHRYHRWWQLDSLLVSVLEIKSPFITRSCLLPALIFSCSAFVVTTNTLWTWHDECNMSLWWCCVPVIVFVGGHQNVRAKFLVRQLQ